MDFVHMGIKSVFKCNYWVHDLVTNTLLGKYPHLLMVWEMVQGG